MGALVQDLKYGLRMLAKNPGLTAVAMLMLALGIGATSAIFTAVDALALRPLAADNPEQLVRFYTKNPQGVNPYISYLDYEDIRQQTESFSGIAVCFRAGRFVNSLDESSQVLVDEVSPDYFTVLGVKPLLGQAFSRQVDSNPQFRAGAVISYGLWQGRLGADPAIIGKEIRLTGSKAIVIGVAPPTFQGLDRRYPTDMWLLTWQASEFNHAQPPQRAWREFAAVGRLREGVSLAQASSELDVLGRRLAATYPETNRGTSFQLTPETKNQREFLPVGLLLMSLVGLVLLIACLNLGGLLLARAESRRRELALRVALGAGRWQLVRQFLAEGVLLSVPGGALGLALAAGLISLRKTLMPAALSSYGPDMRVDFRVIAFTAGTTFLATLLFSLTPAFRAWRVSLAGVLKGGEVTIMRGSRSLTVRNLLVVTQIAMSVILITTSLLFLRSLDYVGNLPVGFDTHKNLAVVDVFSLGTTGKRGAQLFSPLVERIASAPGVKRATYAMRMLLSDQGGGMNMPVSVPGYQLPEGQSSMPINVNAVGPNYFRTVGTRILKGRDFSFWDGAQSQKVVIISQSMARRFWPHDDALGRSIKIQKQDALIVGIAEDARIEDVRESPKPYMYLPYAQSPYEVCAIIVELTGQPDTVIPFLRREIHNYSPSLAIWAVNTARSLVELSISDLIVEFRLIGILSLVGVFLASMGLYGVVAFTVGSRTREIGIRMAIGADLRHVKGLFLLRGLKLALIGVLVGVVVALAAGRLVAGFLYGITPYDPLCWATGAAVVTLIASFASYLPARSAAKVNPIVALKHE